MKRGAWLLCLLLAAPARADEPRAIERLEGRPITLDVGLRRIDPSSNAVIPVDPSTRFHHGDRLVVMLDSSLGGYVRLAAPGADGALVEIWPAPGEAAWPVAPHEPIRLPPENVRPLVLRAPAPTELRILFTKSVDEPRAKRRLKQIKLRVVELADAPVQGPPTLRFEGRVTDQETVALPLTLHHDEPPRDD